MKKLMILLVLAGAMPSALACSQVEPMWVFVNDNDQNHDGKLNRQEWQQAKLDDNIVFKGKMNRRHFRRLDSNGDGVLDNRDGEMHRAFSYKEQPCAKWAEKMRQMSPSSDDPRGPQLAY